MLLKISALTFPFWTLCADSSREVYPGGKRSFDTLAAQIAELEVLASGLGFVFGAMKCTVAGLWPASFCLRDCEIFDMVPGYWGSTAWQCQVS